MHKYLVIFYCNDRAYWRDALDDSDYHAVDEGEARIFDVTTCKEYSRNTHKWE